MRQSVIAVALLLSPLAISFVHGRMVFESSLPEETALGWSNVIRQTMSNSCGPAILASMGNMLSKQTTEFHLIAKASILDSGITLSEFRRIADLIGWSGNWYKGSIQHLTLLHLPLPVHLNQPENHFVLLHSISGHYVTIQDPSSGVTVVSLRQFAYRWTGYFYANSLP